MENWTNRRKHAHALDTQRSIQKSEADRFQEQMEHL